MTSVGINTVAVARGNVITQIDGLVHGNWMCRASRILVVGGRSNHVVEPRNMDALRRDSAHVQSRGLAGVLAKCQEGWAGGGSCCKGAFGWMKST